MASKKGFDAKRSDTFVFDPDDLILVGRDTTDGPSHTLYDKRVHNDFEEPVVQMMLLVGVLVPILICSYEGASASFEGQAAVDDGRQRVINAREAKRRQIKATGTSTIKVEAKVKRGDEAKLALMGVVANEHRVMDDMLVKAEKAKHLYDHGNSIEEIALAFKVTPKAVEQWLPLSNASAPVKKAVQQGTISPTAAAQIVKLDTKEAQEEALAEVIAKGQTSARAVKKAVVAKAAQSKGKDDDGTDGVGIGRKIQKKLLDVATGTPDEDDDPYWDGVRDALRLVLGVKAKSINGKLKTALKKAEA